MSLATEHVECERGVQDAKWGEQNHESLQWFAILGEEFGEVARACVEQEFESAIHGPNNTYREVLDDQDRRLEHLRHELIQTAAVAVAWVECIDRNA